jgi:dTDP-4-amino-4,6-dideoxy-D-galactose acyltransferase
MTGSGGSPSRVELLSWDTDFWGVKAAKIWAATTMELDDGLAECRTLGVRWASLLVPVTNTQLVDSAIRAGFQMVDIRITMSTTVDFPNDEPTTPCLARPDELQQAQALVDGAFRTSRFYLDARLDRARCNDFYRTWVLNSFNGQLADAIVASRHEGTLDAFVTVQRHSNQAASLPLVAVRGDRRGVGVGARVVRDTLNWLGAHGSTRVSVVTQLANIAAIRTYESVGFSIHESGVWLHRWFNVAEP